MISDQQLHQQLSQLLTGTNFDFLGTRYAGKVRDNYTQGDIRYLITTDRLSCFDVIVSTIPFKGQVLTELAAFWFARSKDIVRNHIIDMPDPNVMVVQQCDVLPVEVIVRAYITGSAWRDYQAGKAVSGVTLPPGLKQSEKLPEIIVTPSTKAALGSHDTPISETEILKQGLLSQKLWHQIRETALGLFSLGQSHAAKQGLILVDTKYEFGLKNDQLILVDEIHTLDSSRYWLQSSYQQRFAAQQTPEMLDKEPVRQWLISQGFMGEGKIPEFSADYRVEIARHYLSAYEKITGSALNAEVGSVVPRVERKLREYIRKS